MSRRVRTEHETGGSVEQAFAVLSDESWASRKAAALRDGSQVVRRQETPDGGVTLVTSRALPDSVPGFLTRFLPKDGRVVQTDTWAPAADGTRRGTWSVDVPGAPARLGGTMRLEPSGQGSRWVLEGDVEVRVPLVGGKAESYVAAMLEKLAGKEAAVLRAALPA